MFNLIKYELRGYYKEFIIMASIIILLHLLLFTKINTWDKNLLVVFSVLISFAASIVIFIWNIQVFSRDLHSDSGYLLFTIPKKGYSILGSKLLTSFLQFIIIGLLCFAFNYITFKICIINTYNFNNINHLTEILNKNFITVTIISSIFYYFFLIMMIYFSIILSKITIKNKTFGKFGTFIIFIVICLIIGKISLVLGMNSPISANISVNIFEAKLQASMFNPNFIPFNIPVIIFNITTFIALFIGGSYILENKIDL